jgi:hypothetical protein
MKGLQCIIMVAAMTFVLPAKAHAPQAVGGSLVPIYLVTGVRSSGVDNAGIATAFVCTVSSGATETIKIKVLDSSGTTVVDQDANINSPNTHTFSTNATQLFSGLNLSAPLINPPGTAVISATSNVVFCTAMLVDAANLSPQGIALHQIRFNLVSGTEE